MPTRLVSSPSLRTQRAKICSPTLAGLGNVYNDLDLLLSKFGNYCTYHNDLFQMESDLWALSRYQSVSNGPLAGLAEAKIQHLDLLIRKDGICRQT